jgi:glutathione S-transferase
MLHLIIGNKNYSSWSFRPWFAMKVAGIAFQETLISLDARDFKSRLLALSGAGKVPVLIDGNARVWESLAILEYLAEKFPAAALWPRDPAARGHARQFSAAAAAVAGECVAAGDTACARRRSDRRCGAHRRDLE